MYTYIYIYIYMYIYIYYIYINALENDMYDMIRKVEFTNIRNEFLGNLNRDIESIQSSKNVLVFADKSTTLYELSHENYQKLLYGTIT